jgi:beta-phosphoglucomutase family hydrolase
MPDFPLEAAIFDLDGVVTKTAAVHSRAWKEMFDEFLKAHSQRTGEPFREFDHEADYLPYVDGKPRYKGVADFLASRDIELPEGDPSDPPDARTIHGLGNRKNQLFNEIIHRDGVDVYPSTLAFIRALRDQGVRVGIATSSKNCETILEIAGLKGLFEISVDGVESARLGLRGKPEPDIFTTAADRFNARYDRSMVVEDAVAGVQAGQAGNFGLVLGVSRGGDATELKASGADVVVCDLEEFSLRAIEDWFEHGLTEDQWSLQYWEHQTEEEGVRESLCAIGNGYFGTRGAFEESHADGIHYPGTYIAGVYNRLQSEVAGRTVTNEDFVNCPNWLPLDFRIGDREWIDLNNLELLYFHRKLDFRTGVLHREVVIRDEAGCETRIESQRFASMADPHQAALRYTVTPINYFGPLSFRSALDGTVINAGVERYRALNSRHLNPVEQGSAERESSVTVRTTQSEITISECARLEVRHNGASLDPPIRVQESPGKVTSLFRLDVEKGDQVQVDKLVTIYTSRDAAVDDPSQAGREALGGMAGFDAALADSTRAWRELWDRFDVHIEGDRLAQKLLHLNAYHSLITASPHSAEIDAGILARGLIGEAYRGHIFWDDIFILPLYNMHLPQTARAALMYRYRRLDAARQSARESGYRGAMFPWQSGSSGRDETQVIHLNPLSGEWGPDFSRNQRHVGLAVAYNTWRYYWVTRDREFLRKYGAEMFLEICRFFSSICNWNPERGRYEVAGVMGPDEYHEKYPNSERGGLRDNSYTNIMLVWTLARAPEILAAIGRGAAGELRERIGLGDEELDRWADIGRKISIPISEGGLLEQFAGYFALEDLDWDAYREKYGDIHRMDRILKAEGKSPDAYQVTKQADVLMTFYNLEVGEVIRLLEAAGYSFKPEDLASNYDYYIQRTSHGSTLSRLVHAYIAHLIGRERESLELYREALKSDYAHIQGKSTAEGTHIGVMAGTVHLAIRGYGGLNLHRENPQLEPALPEPWHRIGFEAEFRGSQFGVWADPISARVEVSQAPGGELEIDVGEKTSSIPAGEARPFSLSEGED